MLKKRNDLMGKNEYPEYYTHYSQVYKAYPHEKCKKRLIRQCALALGVFLLIIGTVHGDIGNEKSRQLVLSWLTQDDVLVLAEGWVQDKVEYFVQTAAVGAKPMGEEKTVAELPAAGIVVSSFGWQKATESFNKGIMIETQIDSEVRALADGVVSEVYKDGDYYTVVIEGDEEIVSVYAHCSAAAVEKGMRVQKGDIIGYSGECLVTKGRVYIEMKRYGEPIDPLSYMGAKKV